MPGDAPDKLAKAFDRGADEVIVDLEDAVPAPAKEAARRAVRVWLHDLPVLDVGVWVRINAGPLGVEDVRAVADAPALTGVLVAKTETAAELVDLDRLLSSLGSPARVVPLLESAASILRVNEIAAAPRVQRLQVGEADLRADLGVTLGPDESELLHVRSQVVLASAAAGIAPPIAPVSTNFRDLDAYRASTEALGSARFRRPCLHPPGAGAGRQRGLHPERRRGRSGPMTCCPASRRPGPGSLSTPRAGWSTRRWRDRPASSSLAQPRSTK